MIYSRVYWLLFSLIVCSGPTFPKIHCPNICICEKQEKGLLNIVRNVTNAANLGSQILSKDTRKLDLSSCGLTRIPSELFVNLTNLEILSLARNQITVIEERAFKDLIGLKILNLTDNILSDWKGQIYSELPSLRIIDLTGNVHWKPDKRLLNVTTLSEVRGVKWSHDCVNCLLQRTNNTLTGDIPDDLECNTAMLYEFQGFQVSFTDTCLKKMCEPVCMPKTIAIIKQLKQRSYDRGKYFYGCYAVGSLAFSLNLIVLVNVFLSKAMRREMSMILIANMASCDILISIYVILISKHNVFLATHEQNAQSISQDGQNASTIGDVYTRHCQGSTILLTVGEIVSLVTALLLTIEKYTCIVYCMKPDVRLRKKHTFVVLLVTWIGSFLFAISPYFGIFNLKYSASFMCTMPVTDGKNPTFIIYPLVIVAVNYILMLPMYLRIFLYVRRSSAAVGLHRNAALAKQVSIMVGSNFLFFVVPMVLLVVNVFILGSHSDIILDGSSKDHIVYIWLPIMFFGMNSVLNPFLYAFRRKRFQRELIDRICFGGRLPERLRRAFSALKSSRMTSSASRVDLYEVERQTVQGMENQRRIGRTSSDMPFPNTERVLLCKVTDIPSKRKEAPLMKPG
ncbi:probable glycoprotein hormone G-protein coupled receptor [Actinia tenebrosa]|uniref:Probable glycoprotein hormone G-protein coupled receptor n=1 Tax=Actinia tenebrosa TaxID=6105 RepID=A0A6P8HDA3_ACTTE|nr:probable glycoprotein hormone G-protein coupled receptor [Actinia tenebrosa]XP_031553042.1 probable glycoprotein hormone G-protein coupled receptor [Actinia tenebrosa]XP_031553043.1 probable glycoprotein hormone G-protein coupled receptor [Actinia tenebrosa]XP_031553044.1 probable glycoprotein hormone G-protein coupled receptor [Actinia tenebrosa]XP_031553045.1 probable glycoprotein hormone G-protein coupled receptor [Actinia tenebrosa]XP_031553046.1 probable glycoprotein hormone G-protein 